MLDSVGSRLGPVTCSCEHGNERASFIINVEFLDQLMKDQVFGRTLFHEVNGRNTSNAFRGW